MDFTTGALFNLENLIGSGNDQDVTYSIQQALDFDDINLGGGNDTSRVNIDGVVDVTALGTPTVTNVENGFLTGTTGNDELTISGAQLNALVFGTGTIDFDNGDDVLNLTSTSTNLNSLGAMDGSIEGLETINAITAAAGVTIDLNGQMEDFDVTGSNNDDVITTGAGDDFIFAGDGNDIINGGDCLLYTSPSPRDRG